MLKLGGFGILLARRSAAYFGEFGFGKNAP